MKSSIIVIANPVAKKATSQKFDIAYHYLKSKGYKIEMTFTERKGHAEYIAKDSLKKSPLMIVVAGGDGTFNEVINGLVGSDVPIAILPLGTTNVLAKEIGIPENIREAIEFFLSRSPRNISLGKIVITHHPSPITRYFVLMAGIGFDGEAVFGLNERLKRISGKGAYIFSGVKTLFRFNPIDLKFDIDGRVFLGHSAVVSKAAKYGGNFKITPDANITEPAFYVCIFKGKRRIDIIKYVFGILLSVHLRFKDIEYLKAKNIQIQGEAHIQMDGDYFETTPAQIEVVPNIVKLIF